MRRRWWAVIGLAVVAMAAAASAPADTPKYGGVLNLMQREELPQGLSIHETSTIATVWPASPCFNNLVYFDPMKPTETVDTSWPRNGRDRTAIATWSSSSARASSGTTACRSPRMVSAKLQRMRVLVRQSA
jgi:hypothetical protein